jgi:hypothetical protein
MEKANFNKLSNKLINDGYRNGKTEEDEKLSQIKFDGGFKSGNLYGRKCGNLYAKIKIFAKSSCSNENEIVESLLEVENLLLKKIPESIVANSFDLEFIDKLKALLEIFALICIKPIPNDLNLEIEDFRSFYNNFFRNGESFCT